MSIQNSSVLRPEVGGGETDLVFPDSLVIENKVTGTTADPVKARPAASWQARRYAIAVCRRVAFVVNAHRPADEGAVLPLPARIHIRLLEGAPEGHAQITFLLPWGHGVPSSAEPP
jgi:hypothetical protein